LQPILENRSYVRTTISAAGALLLTQYVVIRSYVDPLRKPVRTWQPGYLEDWGDSEATRISEPPRALYKAVQRRAAVNFAVLGAVAGRTLFFEHPLPGNW
jgi:hypothetical protein